MEISLFIYLTRTFPRYRAEEKIPVPIYNPSSHHSALRTSKSSSNSPRMVSINDALNRGISTGDSDERSENDSKTMESTNCHVKFTGAVVSSIHVKAHESGYDELQAKLDKERSFVYRSGLNKLTQVGAQQRDPISPIR